MAEKDFDLDELLADIDETNIHGEVDFGKPVGKEIEPSQGDAPTAP
jgi:antitoxin component of MazEF toxin-antitoxin module